MRVNHFCESKVYTSCEFEQQIVLLREGGGRRKETYSKFFDNDLRVLRLYNVQQALGRGVHCVKAGLQKCVRMVIGN